MNILVTGACGFIGYHLTASLINQNINVIGIDNLNDYYDVRYKKLRLRELKSHKKASFFQFYEIDISDRESTLKLFSNYKFDIVINLAAQAGVRHSLDNPNAYIQSNLVGFANILDGCKKTSVDHLIFASSSSVYGMNAAHAFNEEDRTDYPVSLYAATKKSNELMAYSYSHLYGIPTTGLRFFTVYGEYGRPDMAYFSFTESILEGKKITVYNNGEMKRDFTYIDDIVEGINRVIGSPPKKIKAEGTNSEARFKIYNIGNNNPISLREFIQSIEDACGKKAKEELLPMQPGDVPITCADIDSLDNDFGFKPKTSIKEGIKKFVKWYKETKIEKY